MGHGLNVLKRGAVDYRWVVPGNSLGRLPHLALLSVVLDNVGDQSPDDCRVVQELGDVRAVPMLSPAEDRYAILVQGLSDAVLADAAQRHLEDATDNYRTVLD